MFAVDRMAALISDYTDAPPRQSSGVAQVAKLVWKKQTQGQKQEIERFCDKKLEQYDQRFKAI